MNHLPIAYPLVLCSLWVLLASQAVTAMDRATGMEIILSAKQGMQGAPGYHGVDGKELESPRIWKEDAIIQEVKKYDCYRNHPRRKGSGQRWWHVRRHPLERASLLMAFSRKDPEKAAQAAALTLYHLAMQRQKPLEHLPEVRLNVAMSKSFLPSQAMNAYARIRDNKQAWEPVERRYPKARQAVEHWFRVEFANYYRAYHPGNFGNLGVVEVFEPIKLALQMRQYDTAGLYLDMIFYFLTAGFHPDGMWGEGSLSYHKQSTGRLNIAQGRWAKWKNGAGKGILHKAPPRFHQKLAEVEQLVGSTTAKRHEVREAMKFPDGQLIPIDDTWAGHAYGQADPKRLRNIELWGYGHFALAGGGAEDAVQAHLHFDPKYHGRGHNHDDGLSVLLWAAGAGDVLSDFGYENDKQEGRYFYTGLQTHNTTAVWGGHGKEVIPHLLGYDDGRRSENRVKFVEACIDEKARRLLLMVSMGQDDAYTVDLSTLTGGETRYWRLNSVLLDEVKEDLTNKPEGEPASLLQQLSSSGYPGGLGNNERLQNAVKFQGHEPMVLQWTGAKTGLGTRIHLNPSQGAHTFTCDINHSAGTKHGQTIRQASVSRQLLRATKAPAEKITTFGAVYETVPKGKEARIAQVDWLECPEGSFALKVETDAFTDWLYFSPNPEPHELAAGLKMAGRVAMVRVDKGNRIQWGYIYGKGGIKAGSFTLAGRAPVTGRLVTSDTGKNQLVLGNLSARQAEAVPGDWLLLHYPRGFAHGLKIKEFTGSGNRGTVDVDTASTPFGYLPVAPFAAGGFEIRANYGGHRSGDKPVKATLLRSTFRKR